MCLLNNLKWAYTSSNGYKKAKIFNLKLTNFLNTKNTAIHFLGRFVSFFKFFDSEK